MPLSVAICDDERVIREQLLRLVENSGDFTADLFSSGEALLKADSAYDIYFLDIQMPGTDGIKTARQVREANLESVIIFITALKEYMQDAFDVQAFHYLIKPIETEKFNEVLSKAVGWLGRPKHSGGYLLIKRGNSYSKIQLKDIYYVESRGKKVILNTKADSYDYYGTMREVEKTAGEAFFRCHRCYIVNLEHVVRFSSDTVWVKGGGEVLMAQKKYPQFAKAFMSFIREGNINA